MTTTASTRSIVVDAPVETVFAFVTDPAKSLQAFPWRGGVVVSDIETNADGTIKGWTLTGIVRLGPLRYQLKNTMAVQEYVPNERFVVRPSGAVETFVFEPVGDRTRLTLTISVSTRIPFLDKVQVFISTEGRGQARNMDMVLARMKKMVEAEPPLED